MSVAHPITTRLDPPHPYFGSKAEAADRIWAALGPEVANFVDPFCGSCAVLYARPNIGPSETVNDAWGFIPNFLRAVQRKPKTVAKWADWPVSELDMLARQRWLLRVVNADFVQRLKDEPTFFDARVAGYWVWGQSIWTGAGWCIPGKTAPRSKLPHLIGAGAGEKNQNPHYGRGIFRKQLPAPPPAPPSDLARVAESLGTELLQLGPSRRDILAHYFRLLAARLARVRIVCGDWRRVLSPAVTYSHGLTGIVLDPPYSAVGKRTRKLYGPDDLDTAAAARAWAAANDRHPLLRIVLCGYEGEHEELADRGWHAVSWKGRGGYGNQDGENANAARERLWLSPGCARADKQLSMDRLFTAAPPVAAL